MTDQNILDKSMRSVFVGNIPYEATEEKLKDIFSEVGPVLSFKLVYGRDTGKPKGYGFCEYKDQETALSAMRNLNNYEIGGRKLRVDNACTEKSRLEMQSLMMGLPNSEGHYGDAVSAERAPEIISKLVSSLPPEQMHDLMHQMKECVMNNPTETRNMLLQNPQLGYALLQAQVIMKIVPPEVAKTMLHSEHKIPPTPQSFNPATTPRAQKPQMPNNNNKWIRQQIPISQMPPLIRPHPVNMDWHHNMNRGPILEQNLRQPSNHIPFPLPLSSVPMEHSQQFMGVRDRRTVIMDSNIRPFVVRDPRTGGNFSGVSPLKATTPMSEIHPMPSLILKPPPSQVFQQPSNLGTIADTEKAALIMQVLQLTDAQIANLPTDQRQSILILKEQIAKSAQGRD